jgi:quercetin dioxygenase-like cupin family protein
MQGQELFDAAGGKIEHHFGGGVYAKETIIPAGVILQQHAHTYDHLSILASGKAAVTNGETVTEYTGPACITIKAGIPHGVLAVTDIVWFCVHATNETDAEHIDHALIQGE